MLTYSTKTTARTFVRTFVAGGGNSTTKLIHEGRVALQVTFDGRYDLEVHRELARISRHWEEYTFEDAQALRETLRMVARDEYINEGLDELEDFC